MYSKLALFALLVASAKASSGYSSFSYDVSDPNTGDIKDQHENRVGGNVVGKYSLLEADGTKRVVEYSANDATGFKAVVHKEPAGPLGALGGALSHSGIAPAGSLAHGSLLAGVSPLTGVPSYAHGSRASATLGYNALANDLGYAGSPSHIGSLYGSYGNGLANPLGYGGFGTPTVSSYSHSILHNGPDSRPYGNAYGGYGAHGGYRGYGSPHANAGFAHGAGWSANAGLTHGAIGNPLATGVYAGGAGYGSKLGW
ncbi:cuticular protein RR-2 motif 61 precursor [Bombyx mori]|uniref:Putative cuticle protein n=1 Tax=Bombyx mori TaxID=7091 RepID=C0H6Q3_BOMMO|nr:cuticular protein RR-2 motif 61 precursor [Bombyx mori]FAA00564.1 TPA: putative cuticle protein [Bombyx mori]